METPGLMGLARFAAGALLLWLLPRCSTASPVWRDPSQHKVQLVRVDDGVRLEVLDWGGSGLPVILLAGGGDTAHVFDDFAPKMTGDWHVYGITRRGYGASGYSTAENASDRLRDDVLAVLDALKLNSVVLVGHSFGGAEMSSVVTRYPNRVTALVYLEAMYPYAFNNGEGPGMKDFQAVNGPQPQPPNASDLASFGALRSYYLRVLGFTYPEAELRYRWNFSPDGRVTEERNAPGSAMLMAVLDSGNKYTSVPAKTLVIFANPHGLGTWVDHSTDPDVRSAAKAYSAALSGLTGRQMRSFRDAVPAARSVNLPGAHHYVFLSNEADVVREMRIFLSGSR